MIKTEEINFAFKSVCLLGYCGNMTKLCSSIHGGKPIFALFFYCKNVCMVNRFEEIEIKVTLKKKTKNGRHLLPTTNSHVTDCGPSPARRPQHQSRSEQWCLRL